MFINTIRALNLSHVSPGHLVPLTLSSKRAAFATLAVVDAQKSFNTAVDELAAHTRALGTDDGCYPTTRKALKMVRATSDRLHLCQRVMLCAREALGADVMDVRMSLITDNLLPPVFMKEDHELLASITHKLEEGLLPDTQEKVCWWMGCWE